MIGGNSVADSLGGVMIVDEFYSKLVANSKELEPSVAQAIEEDLWGLI